MNQAAAVVSIHQAAAAADGQGPSVEHDGAQARHGVGVGARKSVVGAELRGSLRKP
jgi:hypothetical protein